MASHSEELANQQVAKELTIAAVGPLQVSQLHGNDPAKMGKFMGDLYTTILASVVAAKKS